MNVTITFCEGPHDVAFLSKILKTDFYKTCNIKIKAYPKPLNSIFENSLKNQSYEELNIEQVSSKIIPRKILKKDENIILLYALGGNRQYARATKILTTFIDLSVTEEGLIGADDNKYNFLFFNDADEDLDVEVEKINDFLTTYYKKDINLSHNEIKESLGIYIFSHDGKKGTLESLLKSIIQEDNSELCSDIEEFYLKYFNEDKLKRLKLTTQDNVLVEKRNGKLQKEYKTKATINIAGQLQNSGASQVVTIEHSDLLTLDKLQNNQGVQEIIEFFRKVES